MKIPDRVAIQGLLVLRAPLRHARSMISHPLFRGISVLFIWWLLCDHDRLWEDVIRLLCFALTMRFPESMVVVCLYPFRQFLSIHLLTFSLWDRIEVKEEYCVPLLTDFDSGMETEGKWALHLFRVMISFSFDLCVLCLLMSTCDVFLRWTWNNSFFKSSVLRTDASSRWYQRPRVLSGFDDSWMKDRLHNENRLSAFHATSVVRVRVISVLEVCTFGSTFTKLLPETRLLDSSKAVHVSNSNTPSAHLQRTHFWCVRNALFFRNGFSRRL